MLIIDQQKVRASLRMKDAVSAVEAVLEELSTGRAKNFLRDGAETEIGFFRFMAAYSPHLKLAVVNQGFWASGFKGSRDKAKASGILSIYETDKAELRAIVRTHLLNEIRVGAVTAVAAKHLSNTSARVLGLIGSGDQARTQLLGLREVRKIQEARVFSRNEKNRKRFCEIMSEVVEMKLRPVDSAEEAIRDAEIVLEATDAVEPVIDGRILADGAYVSSIKTGRHGSRQLDDETIRRANRFVIDSKDQAVADGAGDLIQPIKRGIIDWENVVELGDVISQKLPGRISVSDILVFKSCGMAICDLAVARVMLDAISAES